MTTFMHALSVGAFAPTLRSFSSVLEKSLAHAISTDVDPATLVDARLAPDMFPLAMQVSLACDQAKNGAARLMDVEGPKIDAADESFERFQARIDHALAFLDTAPEAAFEGAAERTIRLPLQAGLTFEASGLRFLRDWALPHFYFHVVTAYDILRANGAPIGKLDYLAHIAYAIRQDA